MEDSDRERLRRMATIYQSVAAFSVAVYSAGTLVSRLFEGPWLWVAIPFLILGIIFLVLSLATRYRVYKHAPYFADSRVSLRKEGERTREKAGDIKGSSDASPD